ncbi:MAG: flavin reductase family protein [Alphaproteobacteria bacterium]|nr:flavin reductase family protein [Alphaproteobacteria bacterium]
MIASGEFRQAMGRFATGVTVVTTQQDDGTITGLTANAFSALSLDPPLILVCVGYNAGSYAVLRQAERFVVHILAADQTEVARCFASSGADKASCGQWQVSARGNPVLEGCLAVIECRRSAEHEGGDHAILIGAVEATSFPADDAAPLTYYRGQLNALGRIDGGAVAGAGK